MPGGFFVVHTAFGKIGDTSVGGVSIIGVDGDAYDDTFYDSFGNVHRSRLEIDGDVHRWIGLAGRTRCTVTMTDGGMTQVAHHESSAGRRDLDPVDGRGAAEVRLSRPPYCPGSPRKSVSAR